MVLGDKFSPGLVNRCGHSIWEKHDTVWSFDAGTVERLGVRKKGSRGYVLIATSSVGATNTEEHDRQYLTVLGFRSPVLLTQDNVPMLPPTLGGMSDSASMTTATGDDASETAS